MVCGAKEKSHDAWDWSDLPPGEPKLIKDFVELINPARQAWRDENHANTSEAHEDKDSSNQAKHKIPPGLLSTVFSNDALVKIIFLLIKSTLIDTEESEQDQEQLILPLIPAAAFKFVELDILQACSGMLDEVDRRDLQSQLINFPNVDRWMSGVKTPLMYAASLGSVGFAKALFEAKASVQAKDAQGRSVLHFALSRAENPVTPMLLERGANPNDPDPQHGSLLILAVMNGDEKSVRLLLKKSAELTVQNQKGNVALVAVQDKKGNTALHHAASKGNFTLVLLLLENQCSLDVTNKEGETALMMAVNKACSERSDVVAQYNDIVRVLLQYKAAVNLKNKKGETAIQKALQYGLADIGKMLLAAKARPEFKQDPFDVLFQYEEKGQLVGIGMTLCA